MRGAASGGGHSSGAPRHGRPRRRAGRVLALAAVSAFAAATLSGCLTADMSMSLSAEDTVSGTFVFAVDEALLEASQVSAGDLLDGITGGGLFPGAGSAGGTVDTEPYREGGRAGETITFSAVPLDELAPRENGADGITITRTGDVYVVDGLFDLTEATPAPATGPSAGDEITQQMLDSLDLRVAVTFPGDVIEANGDVVGRTVTWTPRAGERAVLSARGSAVPGATVAPSAQTSSVWGAVLAWGLAALLLLVLAGVLVLVLRRGRATGAVSPVDRAAGAPPVRGRRGRRSGTSEGASPVPGFDDDGGGDDRPPAPEGDGRSS